MMKGEATAFTPQERLFHLRPVFTMRHRPRSGLLEMAPWVDVLLLLLMIFIAQTAVLRKPGVAISLPSVAPNTAVPYTAQVLTAMTDGMFFFADQRLDEGALTALLRDAAARDSGGTLLIEADSALSHQSVMRIYALAVEAGWKNVVLATRADDPVEQVDP